MRCNIELLFHVHKLEIKCALSKFQFLIAPEISTLRQTNGKFR